MKISSTGVLVVVAGALAVHGAPAFGRDLVDILPGLYGGDGIFLAATQSQFQTVEHAPHFTASSLSAINQLNDQISREVRALPVGTSSPGARAYEFNEALGTYELASRSLGPILAEESRTVGKGNTSLATTVSVFSYDTFNGRDIGRISVTSLHQSDSIGDPNAREVFENDTVGIEFDVGLEFEVAQLFGTYGISDNWDVSMLLPIVHARLEVSAVADVSISDLNPEPDLHRFDANSPISDQRFDAARGSHSGIGDVVLGTKYYFGQFANERLDIAAQVQWKTASGDEDNFLGTGSNIFAPSFLADYRLTDLAALHVNIGYEWDDDDSLEDAWRTVVGLTVGDDRLTAAIEYSGRFQPRGDEVGDNKSDLSVGVKWNPLRSLIATFAVIVPLNDEGLRTDVIGSLGIAYNL